MRVTLKVQLFSSLMRPAGISSTTVELDKSTANVSNLIEVLGGKFGRELKDQLLSSYVRVIINGKDCQLLGGLMTNLCDGDEVIFFPPIGGG